MVLRCYSRRNLLPAFKHQHVANFARSRAATTSAVLTGGHDEYLIDTASAVVSRASGASASATTSSTANHTPSTSRRSQPRETGHARSSLLSSDSQPWSFFTPSSIVPQRDAVATAGEKHPLVRTLLSELYSTDRNPAANRVWRAYSAVREAEVYYGGSTTPSSLMNQLEPTHHQLVLRAIDPVVSKARKLNRLTATRRSLEAASTSTSPASAFFDTFTRQKLANSTAKLASKSIFDSTYSVKEYMQRVRIIFREMRRLTHDHSSAASAKSIPQLPDLSDFNHVLSRLAPGGHIGVMSDLWNELNGLSAASRAQSGGVSAGIIPNRATYRELMIGLSEHSKNQIERVQKAEASMAARSTGKATTRQSARTVAGGLAGQGQALAPVARGAAILGALRTMALLDDMRDHGVKPNQLTRDLAARTLRLAGHIEGIGLLMAQEYGVDLSAPGSTAAFSGKQDRPRPNVHTMNTVLMALGEQATVPEMISAYETLSRPSPVTSSNASSPPAEDADGRGLFATDWKDIMRSVRNRAIEREQAASNEEGMQAPAIAAVAEDATPTDTSAMIRPTAKTFEIMLQHTCVELDPLRSPAAWPRSAAKGSTIVDMVRQATQTTAAQLGAGGTRAEEMARRSRGDYAIFARYLIQEALELTQQNLHETASGLGVTIAGDLKLDSAELATARWQAESSQADAAAAEPTESSSHDASADASAVETGLGHDEARILSHYVPNVEPGRALESDFLPALDLSSFSITSRMFTPFASLASKRKKIPELRWLQSALSQALTIKLAECKVTETALRTWLERLNISRREVANAKRAESTSDGAVRDASASEPPPLPLSSEHLNTFSSLINQLRELHHRQRLQAQTLEWLLYDKLENRTRTLASKRHEVKKRRKQHFSAIVREEEARKQAEMERVALRKAQAEEARRQKNLLAGEAAALAASDYGSDAPSDQLENAQQSGETGRNV